MNIIQRFGVWLSRGVSHIKAAVMPLIPAWARHAFPAITFRSLVQEGYKGNGIVFACISALAFAFPEPQLKVWKETTSGRQWLRLHGLAKLLRRPNPDMGFSRLMLYTIVYLAIGGNCYWYKVRSAAGKVVEIWPLHDGQLSPVPGGDRLIGGYELDTGEKKIPIPAKDVVHFMWMPDPLMPWRGLAPLVAVAREVDMDNEATRYIFSLLKNDAMPRLALIIPESMDTTDPDTRKRLKAEWQQEQGGENRGRVALLEGGMDIKQIALNLKELEMNLLRRVPESRITAAFRVPAIVAGAAIGLENATYNNSREFILFFTERTLVPLWGMLDDQIQFDLLPEFDTDENTVVEFDLNTVLVLAEKSEAKRAWALDALTRGAILLNEFRSVAGLPLDANGNVYLRTMAQVTEPFTPMAGSGMKGLPAPAAAGLLEGKVSSIDKQKAIITALRRERRAAADRMETSLNRFFQSLADRVVHRARKAWDVRLETKADDLPDADDLITPEDSDELEEVLRKHFFEIMFNSWDIYQLNFGGLYQPFDPDDPIVTRILADAGKRVRLIDATTLEQLRYTLRSASTLGWSIDHLVRGDPELGIPGLRQIIEEAYKNRARTIARTELGNAQQQAAVGRYKSAGVERVRVFDNGFDDSAPGCVILGNGNKGTVAPMDWAAKHAIGHPNCVRCFAAEFDEPVDDDVLEQWRAVGDRW